MSDAGADAGIRLSEFLETPEGEWVHREMASRTITESMLS
jgi:hypothetical protein